MEPLKHKFEADQVERLEDLARHSMQALELCASLGDFQSAVTKFKNRKDIFERAVQGLRQALPVSMYAFYSVDGVDFDIDPEHADPPENWRYIRQTVDDLIEKGLVALAFREKQTLADRTRDGRYSLLIHALATTSQTYGIFFGFLEKGKFEASIAEKITSIIIKLTCYALENFELYQLVQQKNETLVEKNLQLSRSEILYRNTFENTGNATIVVDAQGTVIYANTQFSEFSGFEKEVLSDSKNISDFIAKNSGGRVSFSGLPTAADDGEQAPAEYVFENRSGGKKTVFLKISPLGLDERYIISFTDVTPIKEAEKQLEFQAFHDPLTGLPNRVLFQDRLKQAVKKKNRYPAYNYGLMFIDLDRFKAVNDTLGHHVGDQLLIEVGARIAACVREVDTVARFGGDEFMVLLENVHDKNCCDVVSQRILEKFQEPIYMAADHEIIMTLSMGVLVSTEEIAGDADVIRLADMSMYEAKKQGRNQVVYSHKISNKEIEEKLYLENHLQRAIKNEEFFVQYQPLMDLDRNELYGLETLVRWNHPELGIVPPNRFIPIAEETGFIIPLGRKIVELAFRDFAAWRKQYAAANDLYLSVNVSVKQMLQSDLAEDLTSMAEAFGVPLDYINLEITESIFIDDMDRAVKTIAGLKDLGVSISIDDFGTGYSSIKYLNQFSIDLVKIDKVLIENITGSPTNLSIVASMLDLCQRLNLKAMAEGIEDLKQLEKLKTMDCKFGQGFYFAPPQDKSVVEQHIRRKIG
ncbi:MAG: EAL domain-containing protein [Desulfobacteraceae bacterium]|nr:EAL domain-containing protein [Desulfobacteraceae bacterium]